MSLNGAASLLQESRISTLSGVCAVFRPQVLPDRLRASTPWAANSGEKTPIEVSTGKIEKFERWVFMEELGLLSSSYKA